VNKDEYNSELFKIVKKPRSQNAFFPVYLTLLMRAVPFGIF